MPTNNKKAATFSKEAEQAVLIGIMDCENKIGIEEDDIEKAQRIKKSIVSLLETSDFHETIHQEIYEIILTVDKNSSQTGLVSDQICITQQAVESGIGGKIEISRYIADLNRVKPQINTLYPYAQIVKKHSLNRSVSAVSNKLASTVSIATQLELVQELQSLTDQITKVDSQDLLRNTKVRTVRDYCGQDIPDIQWICQPLLATKTTLFLYAPTGKGKTFFVHTLAMGIAVGNTEFGEWKMHDPQNVLVLDGEMQPAVLMKRFKKLEEQHRIFPERLKILTKADFGKDGDINLCDRKWQKIIEGIVAEHEIKVLVLDNLSSLFDFKQTDQVSSAVVSNWMLKMNFSGVAVIAVHHSRRQIDEEGSNMFGSVALTQKVDCAIQCKATKESDKDDEDSAIDFTIVYDKARLFSEDDRKPYRMQMNDEGWNITLPTAGKNGGRIGDIAQCIQEGTDTTATIAEALDLNASTIRSSLRRLIKKSEKNGEPPIFLQTPGSSSYSLNPEIDYSHYLNTEVIPVNPFVNQKHGKYSNLIVILIRLGFKQGSLTTQLKYNEETEDSVNAGIQENLLYVGKNQHINLTDEGKKCMEIAKDYLPK